MTRLDELIKKFENEISINEPLSVDKGDGFLIDLKELLGEVRKVVGELDRVKGQNINLRKTLDNFIDTAEGHLINPDTTNLRSFLDTLYEEIQKEMESKNDQTS